MHYSQLQYVIINKWILNLIYLVDDHDIQLCCTWPLTQQKLRCSRTIQTVREGAALLPLFPAVNFIFLTVLSLPLLVNLLLRTQKWLIISYLYFIMIYVSSQGKFQQQWDKCSNTEWKWERDEMVGSGDGLWLVNHMVFSIISSLWCLERLSVKVYLIEQLSCNHSSPS